MKRTHTYNELHETAGNHATHYPLMYPSMNSSLASKRLDDNACEWMTKRAPSHTISLLRPCAMQCTTWQDAVTAFSRLGHGGSVVYKRGDGMTRFVGTVPTLRAWWTHYMHANDRHPVVIEENLWSRHPRSSVACIRYAFGSANADAGAVYVLNSKNRASTPLVPKVAYEWKTISQPRYSPALRAIVSATQTFVHANRPILPSKGVLDLCWFVDDHCVYIVDGLSCVST